MSKVKSFILKFFLLSLNFTIFSIFTNNFQHFFSVFDLFFLQLVPCAWASCQPLLGYCSSENMPKSDLYFKLTRFRIENDGENDPQIFLSSGFRIFISGIFAKAMGLTQNPRDWRFIIFGISWRFLSPRSGFFHEMGYPESGFPTKRQLCSKLIQKIISRKKRFGHQVLQFLGIFSSRIFT